MLWVLGVGKVELQMDKSPGQLDEPLVESVIGSLASILEPEMFQNIMCFIIVPGIEALEITEIARIEVRFLIQIQRFHKRFDAVGFVHGSIVCGKTNLRKQDGPWRWDR